MRPKPKCTLIDCGINHNPECPVFNWEIDRDIAERTKQHICGMYCDIPCDRTDPGSVPRSKVVEAKTVVVTKKTTTTEIRIQPGSLITVIQDAVEKATGIRPTMMDMNFGSDMGPVSDVHVHIKLVKEENL